MQVSFSKTFQFQPIEHLSIVLNEPSQWEEDGQFDQKSLL